MVLGSYIYFMAPSRINISETGCGLKGCHEGSTNMNIPTLPVQMSCIAPFLSLLWALSFADCTVIHSTLPRTPRKSVITGGLCEAQLSETSGSPGLPKKDTCLADLIWHFTPLGWQNALSDFRKINTSKTRTHGIAR